VAEVLPEMSPTISSRTDSAALPVAELAAKPVQDRFVTNAVQAEVSLPKEPAPTEHTLPEKPTKTAEATGGLVAAPAK
jgi:hypothetical protein